MPRPVAVQLSIPQPCHEPWEQMTRTSAGRFCASCEKEVVDFTGMTDGEVAAWFAKWGHGPGCGHFRPDQLSRPLLPAPKPAPVWHRWALAAMAVFGWRAVSPEQVQAQVGRQPQTVAPPPRPLDQSSQPNQLNQSEAGTEVITKSCPVAVEAPLNIKGALRPSSTVYYVNGVKQASMPNLPTKALEPARDVKPRRATSLKEDRVNYRNMLEGEPTSIPLTR